MMRSLISISSATFLNSFLLFPRMFLIDAQDNVTQNIALMLPTLTDFFIRPKISLM